MSRVVGELDIRAVGTPAPQGSFFAILVKGRPQVVADNKATKPWRADVVAAAELAMRAAGGWLQLNEPVSVEMVFYLERPPSIGRARVWPHVRPDLDKYIRSTLDALTGSVVTDDSRVVRIVAEKRYCEPGQPAGARIRVRSMADQLAVL